jgi:hypothetical protein
MLLACVLKASINIARVQMCGEKVEARPRCARCRDKAERPEDNVHASFDGDMTRHAIRGKTYPARAFIGLTTCLPFFMHVYELLLTCAD